MPTSTAQDAGIAPICEQYRVTYEETVFLCVAKVGFSNGQAYQYIRPWVEDKPAKTMGTRWMGKLRNTFSKLTVRQALNALGDIVAVELAMNPDSPDRLAAAKELNKVAGRYREAVDVSDLAAVLAGLSTPARAGTEEPDGLDELASVVDLTRPGGEGGDRG